MTETNSSDASDLSNAHRSNADSESEAFILTQEEAVEHIRTSIGPSTRQLKDLTQQLQGLNIQPPKFFTGGVQTCHLLNLVKVKVSMQSLLLLEEISTTYVPSQPSLLRLINIIQRQVVKHLQSRPHTKNIIDSA